MGLQPFLPPVVPKGFGDGVVRRQRGCVAVGLSGGVPGGRQIGSETGEMERRGVLLGFSGEAES